MKRYYIASAVIAVTNAAIYPLIKELVYRERGYYAHGGETLLMICGFILAAAVLNQGFMRVIREPAPSQTCGAPLDPEGICGCIETKGSLPEGSPPLTESEQSENNHFDAITISRRI